MTSWSSLEDWLRGRNPFSSTWVLGSPFPAKNSSLVWLDSYYVGNAFNTHKYFTDQAKYLPYPSPLSLLGRSRCYVHQKSEAVCSLPLPVTGQGTKKVLISLSIPYVLQHTLFVMSRPSCLAWKREEHWIQKNPDPYYYTRHSNLEKIWNSELFSVRYVDGYVTWFARHNLNSG